MPLLHIHGGKDEVVSAEHHIEIYKESREKETAKSTFIFLPEGDHWFTQAGDRKILLQETSKWFKNVL